jgi:hypothetical protein
VLSVPTSSTACHEGTTLLPSCAPTSMTGDDSHQGIRGSTCHTYTAGNKAKCGMLFCHASYLDGDIRQDEILCSSVLCQRHREDEATRYGPISSHPVPCLGGRNAPHPLEQQSRLSIKGTIQPFHPALIANLYVLGSNQVWG